MTKEQIAACGPEAMTLLNEAKQQLEEHKLWLANEIVKAAVAGQIERNFAQELVGEVYAIALKRVTPEPSLLEDGKPTLTVQWDYTDLLYDYLASPACIPDLRKCLDKAIVFKGV